MQDKTAVSKYKDFEYNGLKFQIKANRPSGKRGSKVTKVGHASKKSLEDNGWDILIWILYNEEFEIKETWVWNFF